MSLQLLSNNARTIVILMPAVVLESVSICLVNTSAIVLLDKALSPLWRYRARRLADGSGHFVVGGTDANEDVAPGCPTIRN